jgi:hypothetical protein
VLVIDPALLARLLDALEVLDDLGTLTPDIVARWHRLYGDPSPAGQLLDDVLRELFGPSVHVRRQVDGSAHVLARLRRRRRTLVVLGAGASVHEAQVDAVERAPSWSA